jgi:hypothetical protein
MSIILKSKAILLIILVCLWVHNVIDITFYLCLVFNYLPYISSIINNSIISYAVSRILETNEEECDFGDVLKNRFSYPISPDFCTY